MLSRFDHLKNFRRLVQPTTQPTIPVALCDLRVLRQSPRICKLF